MLIVLPWFTYVFDIQLLFTYCHSLLEGRRFRGDLFRWFGSPVGEGTVGSSPEVVGGRPDSVVGRDSRPCNDGLLRETLRRP